jgi:hypothetical protein
MWVHLILLEGGTRGVSRGQVKWVKKGKKSIKKCYQVTDSCGQLRLNPLGALLNVCWTWLKINTPVYLLGIIYQVPSVIGWRLLLAFPICPIRLSHREEAVCSRKPSGRHASAKKVRCGTYYFSHKAVYCHLDCYSHLCTGQLPTFPHKHPLSYYWARSGSSGR